MSYVIPRSLSGIFCDDIRQEIRGKRTLVGCYTGTMEVSDFPVVLPKLCIVAIVQGSTDKPFRNIKLVVLKDDEQLLEGQLPVPDAPNASANAMQRFDVQFVLSPFNVDAPCTLRVRAHVDDEEIRGLALTICKVSESRLAEDDATQAPDSQGKRKRGKGDRGKGDGGN